MVNIKGMVNVKIRKRRTSIMGHVKVKGYAVACFLYSIVCSLLQVIFYSKNWVKSIRFLASEETIYWTQAIDFDLNILNESKVDKPIEFMHRYIQSESILEKIAKALVTEDIKKKLFDMTGFKYKIDYITFYKTKPLNEENRHSNIYANFFHYDKPNSRFMVKVIFPIPPVSAMDGPFQIMTSEGNLLSHTTADKEVMIIFPRKTLHRDSVPMNINGRKQIMLRLIPSNNYRIGEHIYKRQLKTETKFPELRT